MFQLFLYKSGQKLEIKDAIAKYSFTTFKPIPCLLTCFNTTSQYQINPIQFIEFGKFDVYMCYIGMFYIKF